MMSNNAFVGGFSGLSVILLQPLEILKVTLILNPTQKSPFTTPPALFLHYTQE